MPKPFKNSALLILDGWGLGPNPAVDAIAQAKTPFVDSLYQNYPHSTLVTYGEDVGLPEGQMGNSEVGHLNIGAGRIVYQELARIHKAIRERSLHEHPTLLKALHYAKKQGKKVHLIGLVSDGGVHSHLTHLQALCDICVEQGLENVFIHAFTDGRDTDPKGGLNYLNTLSKHIESTPIKIASVIGRYYAMDRDKRWERIQLAYDLLVRGKGKACHSALAAVKESYEAGISDEFIDPWVVVDQQEMPLAIIESGDVVISYNFRTDRCRQITEVLTQKAHPAYNMEPLSLYYCTMTRYDESFKNIEVIYEKDDLSKTLGETLANAGKTQVRIAETEKYPHVTFFFSGGREEAFIGEKRIIVPSPKVATYDLQPEMSALEITDKIVAEIEANHPNFIALNYANADMVGHTGVFEAAIRAAETVDSCVSRLVETLLAHDYAIIIIADHGNSDYMVNADGSPNTAHTKNPVPCIFVSQDSKSFQVKAGKLADIAPTILHLMDIEIPEEMDGQNLIIEVV